LSAQLAILLVGIGVVTSLVAASASAFEAATLSPIQARIRSRLEARTTQILPFLASGGAMLMTAGGVLSLVPSQSLIVGFAALMALIIGYGLLIPWIVAKAITWARNPGATFKKENSSKPSLNSNLLLVFSIGGIQRSISRTGVAIAALCIAVSATFGVDIMIGSFRTTVAQWLETTLQSDIYITVPDSASTRSDGIVDSELTPKILALRELNDWSTGKTRNVMTNAGEISMLVLKPHHDGATHYDFIDGNAEDIWQSFLMHDSVLVSEPFANKHGLSRRDLLDIFTQTNGDQSFSIAGVYKDYGSSHGRLTMARKIHNQHWQDRAISTIGLKLSKRASIEKVLADIRSVVSAHHQQLIIRSNREIRERSLEVFDRTFEVTRVLRLLTIGVAFIGIFSALLALQMERAREFAILRASGATSAQVALVVMVQTLLMGAIAGILALPLGWLMSEILIHVINLRSFGWSMKSMLPDGAISNSLALALLSACLAGIYPAWRLSTITITSQLRDE